MGGSRSCQRQTCTASRTDSGLAVLAFALRLVPRCRANLAPQAVCLLFKSRRVRSIPKASNPQPWMAVPNPSHWQAQSRPSVSIGATSAQPQIVIRASSHPKPSAFHSHVSTCQPTIGASFQPTALNRPRTPRANFTLAHKSVLVKFSFSRTQRRALNRAARASSHAVRFTSERRKWFLPCSGCSALVPRRRAASHRKGFVYFLSQALPRPLRSKASNPSAASDIPTAPRCRPYPTAQPSAIWSAMFTAHSPTPCPNAKPSHYATASALVGVPMFRSPQPTSTSPPSHPTAQTTLNAQPSPVWFLSAHANAPSPARHLPSPAPNRPPVGRALGCLPRLRLKWRASHISCFRLARAPYNFL